MRNFLMRLSYTFNRFMMGKYGVDRLSRDIVLASVIFNILSSFLRIPLFYYIGTVLLLWAVFRVFSKNIQKRRAELYKYTELIQKLKKKIQFKKDLREMKKTHRLYKCKNCKTILRVPKGVGKIKITCAKCKTTMIKKA